MSEKQPTAYVVCRYDRPSEKNDWRCGDNFPVKVFDTRREARAYAANMEKRSRKYDYTYCAVKQG